MTEEKIIITENKASNSKVPQFLLDSTDGSSYLERFSNILSIAIVTCGFILIAWYGYKLNNKAVDNATLPVIKSDASPIKVKPADPGGMVVLNMDKTIYENVSGNSPQKADSAERISPPPEEPVDRRALLDKIEQNVAQPVAPVQPVEQPAVVASSPTEIEQEATAPQAAPAAAGAAKEVTLKPATEESPVDTSFLQPVVKKKITAKPVRKDMHQLEKAPPTGKYRIQLASFKSNAEALAEWEKLKKRHAKILGKAKPVIEKKALEKGVFYRLQVPYAKTQEARNACKALTAAHQSCFLVK